MLVMVVFFIAFRWIHLSTPLIRLDRKSGSAGMPRPISYAVFCLKKRTCVMNGLRIGRVDNFALTGQRSKSNVGSAVELAVQTTDDMHARQTVHDCSGHVACDLNSF